MPELKDPAIKLFGKTIQLLPPDNNNNNNKKPSRKEVAGSKNDESSTQPIVVQDLKCLGATSSGIGEDPKTPRGAKKENPSPYSNSKTTDNPDPNETNSTTSALDEKILKKPDKIVPCPRCNSMDTKFCYYNNYNVNQPRHFCKNCQRYWTAGGSMRNVPIGSGRRKNKTSPYRQIIVPESLQPVNFQNNVLAFGSDEPLCESMASVLKLADTNTTSSLSQTENVIGPPTPTPVPCFPAPPWPWTNQMLPPVFGPSTYPVSFYPVPAPYWGYTCALPNPWNMALLPQQFPTLGKHQREVRNDHTDEDKSYSPERGVLTPKTLRMNDPNEAAKSSILSTLGINNENAESTEGSTLYKAFRYKGSDDNNHAVEASPALQANPAALSRSLNFHETS